MTTTINNEHKKLNVPNSTDRGNVIRNVPHLRFPEFEGEWEKSTLDKVCVFHNGRAYKQNELLQSGKYRVLRVGNFFTNDSWYYSNLELEEEKIAVRGDLLYAWSASFGPRFWHEEKVIYHYHIWKVDSFQNVTKSYLYYYLEKDATKIKNEVQGGTMVHITKGDMEKRAITYPCIEEQKKIAKLLSILDERIATQNKIIDKLQSLIKGIRHDIFKDIQGEVLALSNIADIYQPQTISSSDLTSEGYWVYGANGIIGKYKEYNHETEQICITCRGNTCGTVNYTQPKVWITGNSMVINTDKYQRQVNKRFLFHYLSSYKFKSIVSGSGQPQIVRTPLEKIKVVLPTIEKQVRIANSIDIVSEKINTESSVLRLLEKQKQYLFRQMFI